MQPTQVIFKKVVEDPLARCEVVGILLLEIERFIQYCPRPVGKNPKSAAGHDGGTKCTGVAEAEGGGKSVVVEVEEGEHDGIGWSTTYFVVSIE